MFSAFHITLFGELLCKEDLKLLFHNYYLATSYFTILSFITVAVSAGVKERVWQLVSSSTTFDSTAINGEQHHTTPWTLTSIVRKIIVAV